MVKIRWKTTAAAVILKCFKTPSEGTRLSSPAWSMTRVRQATKLPYAELRPALAALVATGRLSFVSYAENSSRSGVLYGLSGSRTGFYMLPERLQELEEARDKRLQQPYWEQARANIMERYADEVQAEFERLWETRKKES